MMVYIEQLLILHHLGHNADAVEGASIHHDQYIASKLASLLRPLSQLNAGNKAKAFINQVITVNDNLLAQLFQAQGKAQAGAQSISIRAHMGA